MNTLETLMIRVPRFAASAFSAIALAGLAACADSPVSSEPELLAAKGGAGNVTVAVQAASPAYGRQGDVGLVVTITGSGFDAGSQATWERGGAPDPKVTVRSSQFVSATQVVATIDIAGDAEISFYDIAVTTSGGRKGIGTERFEVTTANLIPELSGPGNSSQAWGINEAGQTVGRSRERAFFFDRSTGIEDLGPGRAMDLNDAATTIVGASSTALDALPVIWIGGPGNWTRITASTTCVPGSLGGAIRAITPSGALAGGRVTVEGDRKKTYIPRPVLWDLADGSCTQLPLPPGRSQGFVEDVTETGIAVGVGIIWYPDGTYATLSPLAAGNEVRTYGINETGTIIVGSSGQRPAYGVRNGSSWSGPTELVTVTCPASVSSWAADVNDSGLIVGRGCDLGAWHWQFSGGQIIESQRLPGFGAKGQGSAEAVNDAGSGLPSVAGGSNDRAVYWIR
jgi:hypothetical protein